MYLRAQDAFQMDPQRVRMQASSLAAHTCLQKRAHAGAQHASCNPLHELQAARCHCACLVPAHLKSCKEQLHALP